MPADKTENQYKARYYMLLNSIPSSVLVFDRQMRIVSANRNFLDKSRRREADTIGKRLGQVFPEIILEQIDIEGQIQQVFRENRPLPGQRLSYRAPGVPLRIYYYQVLPYANQDAVENVILLMEDVTQQTRLRGEVQQVENHLASVINSASDIVVSTDLEGAVLSWNPAAEKITGMSWAMVNSKSLFDLCPQKNRDLVRKLWSDVIAQSVNPITEWELNTVNGDSVLVSWVCSLLQDSSGHPSGVVAAGRDLSEQRRLEMQLIQSQKLAALGVMAGGIAHQVRNPLAVCSSAAQFLEDDTTDAQLRKTCAAKIHKSIHKASSIIENLLKFARPASGFEKELVDVAGLMGDALELIHHQAQVKKIRVDLRLPQPTVFVNGNSDLLQQAVVNLMLNAIEAMPQGGTLTVDITSANPQVILKFRDTGCGMAPEHVDKIFDPFFTRASDRKGTGLGLSICFAIIELHGGKISVHSELQKGSEFTVVLPRA